MIVRILSSWLAGVCQALATGIALELVVRIWPQAPLVGLAHTTAMIVSGVGVTIVYYHAMRPNVDEPEIG